MKKQERRRRLMSDVEIFRQKYGRKSKHINGFDPNDRAYDRKVEELIKRMDPIELDELLRGEEEEEEQDEV